MAHDPISEAAQRVLALLHGPLADVRFPDADRNLLDADAAAVRAADQAVHDAEAALSSAKDALDDAQRQLRERTQRALAYARIFAETHPGVRFGCVASAAPAPRSMRFARRIRSPYAAFTAAIYSTLYQFASKVPDVYPYARPNERELALLRSGIDDEIGDSTNDGIVPTLSMLHGSLIWAGEADHLDVLGHFADDEEDSRRREPGVSPHRDWITSGARFSRKRFNALLDAVAAFQLQA